MCNERHLNAYICVAYLLSRERYLPRITLLGRAWWRDDSQQEARRDPGHILVLWQLRVDWAQPLNQIRWYKRRREVCSSWLNFLDFSSFFSFFPEALSCIHLISECRRCNNSAATNNKLYVCVLRECAVDSYHGLVSGVDNEKQHGC